jgi:cytochrome c oxidase cbb3-type subunit 3
MELVTGTVRGHPYRLVVLLLAVVLLAACGQFRGDSTAQAPKTGLPPDAQIAAVPVGDIAGAARSDLPESMNNPYEGNAQAAQEGKTLFSKMNCAGCHGYDGKGGMGPSLVDHYWRYGGVPVKVFKSIYEGRPQGMPAWGQALPPQEIWKIVAYIETLGGTFPAAQYHAALQGDLGNAAGPNQEKAQEPNRTAPQQ